VERGVESGLEGNIREQPGVVARARLDPMTRRCPRIVQPGG